MLKNLLKRFSRPPETILFEGVKLTKRGKNYFGLCPFHEETKPSFSINLKKGIYYCFGCGKGGLLEEIKNEC